MTSEDEIRISENSRKLIFRYKFSDSFAQELYEFSKIHQYDDRATFKEEWTTWTEENDELIETEIKRLETLGYQGNILNKMFAKPRQFFFMMYLKKLCLKDA